jgi:hypothetical protein
MPLLLKLPLSALHYVTQLQVEAFNTKIRHFGHTPQSNTFLECFEAITDKQKSWQPSPQVAGF